MFGCKLKLINWDFPRFFMLLAINQNVDSQLCGCENSPPSHELS